MKYLKISVPNQPIQPELVQCLHKICILEDHLLLFKEIVLLLATLRVAQVIPLPLGEVEDTEEITELMEEIVGDIMALRMPVDMGK